MAEVKKIVEALLFASSDPLSLSKIRRVIEQEHVVSLKELKVFLEELKREYQEKPFEIEEIAEGYIFRSRQEYAPYISFLQGKKRKETLSRSALEVLSIIAYRQPITRPQMETIRGVDSSGIIHTLLDRELIESAGKLEVPGRPTLYVTTKMFLKYFGLKELKELPPWESKSK